MFVYVVKITINYKDIKKENKNRQLIKYTHTILNLKKKKNNNVPIQANTTQKEHDIYNPVFISNRKTGSFEHPLDLFSER